MGVALGDEFMALYPDVTFTYEGIGSSGGVKNAADGTTMLGDSIKKHQRLRKSRLCPLPKKCSHMMA